jgi:hypothetical protein
MFGFPSGYWTAHRELSRAVLAVLPIVAGTDRAHAVAEKYPGMKRFQVRLDAEDDCYADVYARQDVIDLSSLQTRRRDHDGVIRVWVISVRPTLQNPSS